MGLAAGGCTGLDGASRGNRCGQDREAVPTCQHVARGGDFVADRLTPRDVSFLYLEEPTTPMHVGSVSIFRVPQGGFDYERLVTLIQQRIAFVPRFRQRVRGVPGRLANPVWVDDGRFDLA